MSNGRCLCGAIRFVTDGEPIFVSHCHCESCRRQSGSIPATFVGFMSGQVDFSGREVTEHNSSPDVFRGFCGACGSALYYRHAGWGETHLYIGALDDPGAYRAGGHVFYDEHVEGYEMHDNLPRFGASGKQPIAWGPLPTRNVLYLCTGNSARSILAEAITNYRARGGIRAFSAGSSPAGRVHPEAIAELESRGFATEHLESKAWDRFVDGPEIEWVITLCDAAAAETCPVFPGDARREHWGLPDPAAGAATFAETYEALDERIQAFLERA